METATPVPPWPETGDPFAVFNIIEGAPGSAPDYDATFPTLTAEDFAVVGLVFCVAAAAVSPEAVARRLGRPVADVVASLARLEAAALVTSDPAQWW